jgi:crossover junction endodeoxyribonuclease RuvC
MTALLILGVDPGLNRCGWGLVASEGSRLMHVAHGVIKPPAQQQLASRLHDVFDGLCAVIVQYNPHEVAVEETFVNSNARAALALGQARGVALAAAARGGLAVAEYSPATVKKAVVGSGAMRLAAETTVRGVAECDAQSVSGVSGDCASRRQKPLHHECDLGFVRGA